MTSKQNTIGWKTAMVAWAAFLGLIACDDKSGLVDENYKGEPLATVNGTLSISSPEGGGKISVAVAWLSAEDGGDLYWPDFIGDEEGEVACDGTPAPYQHEPFRANTTGLWALQAVEYEATSLINFKLPIMELPPESARQDLAEWNNGEGWHATGIIIAFIDKDADGQYDASTPDTVGDTFIAASENLTEDSEYVASVTYLNGTLSDDAKEFWGHLKQGFNLEIEKENYETGEEEFTSDLEATIDLFPPNDATLWEELVELQCSEVEYQVEFNKSFSRDDYSDSFFGCMSLAVDGSTAEDGPSLISLSWDDGTIDPENICVVHEMEGAVCFSNEELPQEWMDFCGLDESFFEE
jgi:hypothetical protein